MNFSIFNTLLDAAIVIDSNQSIVYCNETVSTLTETPMRRLLKGKKIGEAFLFDTDFLPENMTAIQDPQPYVELQYTTRKGTRGAVQASVQPVPDHEGLWLVFMKDVTLETDLHNRYKVERKNRLEAIEESRIDPLTKIYNKRAFLEKFGKIFEKAKEIEFNLFLIVFDLDDFKKANDMYGHQAGDYILHELASFLSDSSIRDSDFFARFGGEEFVVILQRCSFEVAKTVAQRIQESVANHDFVYKGQKMKVTVSVGLARLTKDIKTAEEFFEKADKASYQSKQSGKNRYSIAS